MIIGLGHQRGVGKSTVGKIIENYFIKDGYDVEVTSFAKEMKKTAFQIFNWAGLENEEFYEKNYHLKEVILPKINKSPRTLWVETGNKMREIYPDIWIQKLFSSLKSKNTIITDIRYLNEANAIKNKNGLCFKVFNSNNNHYKGIDDETLKDFKDWDSIIYNNTTLKELEENVEFCLYQFHKRIDKN